MEKVKLCGLLVSKEVAVAATKTWPTRPATGYDDRSWGAACANHVMLTARDLGETPDTDPEAARYPR